MAGHQLIDAHLAALARGLPADAVDELADGLIETWQHHCDAGLPSADAARAAITEFGTIHEITEAFVTNYPGRRTARLLLVTGPIVGLCWGASLVVAHAWTWPVPIPAAAMMAIALLAVVVMLITSATSRRSYRRARLGTAGSIGLVVLDATMLAGVLLAAPTIVWPMLIAIPVSLARIGLAIRSLPTPLAR
jgi:hypothetical protein